MKKYGLIGSASSRKSGSAAQKRPRTGAASSVAAAFGGGDDSGDEQTEDLNSRAAVNRRLAEDSKRRDAQLQLAAQADPSIYDYDGVYEEMKAGEKKGAPSSSSGGGGGGGGAKKSPDPKKSRYIENLLKQAKMREVEQDRVFERKLQREREAQDAEMGESELKFITSAYKKKLIEQKKWQLQQKLEDEREAKQDVTTSGMGNFYSNLLTKNIAMGGDVSANATSAFTTGSRRNEATIAYKTQQEKEDDAKRQERLRSEEEDREASAVGSDVPEAEREGASARMVDPKRLAAETNTEDEGTEGGPFKSEPESSGAAAGPAASAVDTTTATDTTTSNKEGVREEEAALPAAVVAARKLAAAMPAKAAEATTDALAAARERALQRKRQREAGGGT